MVVSLCFQISVLRPAQVQGADQGGHPGQRLHEEPGALTDPGDRGLHVPGGVRQGELHH